MASRKLIADPEDIESRGKDAIAIASKAICETISIESFYWPRIGAKLLGALQALNICDSALAIQAKLG